MKKIAFIKVPVFIIIMQCRGIETKILAMIWSSSNKSVHILSDKRKWQERARKA